MSGNLVAPPSRDSKPAPAAKPEPVAKPERGSKSESRSERARPAASRAPESAPVEVEAKSAPPLPPLVVHSSDGTPRPFDAKTASDVFDEKTTFAELGLRADILRAITEAGFVHPTAIQSKIIPVILAGKDVLGQAKTGTGKTAAFGLPLLSNLPPGEAFSALVMVPTRELALQVAADLNELGRYSGLQILPVYGGQNIATQAKKLSTGPEIIVATPGRVMDMQERGYLRFDTIKAVVLDEVDRMLDIGFRDDIRRILSMCPKTRQTIFVSATLTESVESLARSFARDCEKIVATTGSLTATMVKQFYLSVQPWDKKQLLLHLLTHEQPALTLVFCRTKRTVDSVSEYLKRKGIEAHAIHGDMAQGKRNSVIAKLRSGQLTVLIASDLASRGLDVEGITHVINYDLPEDPDLYVHRIGRTARAGRDGVAWSLVTTEQGDLLTQIEMLINAEVPKLDYPDFLPGPLPADVANSLASDARRQQAAKSYNRFAATPLPAAPPAAAAGSSASEVDPSRFPGGIVPTKLPERRLGGKVKTARGMKQAIAQTLQPATAPGVVSPTPPASPEQD